jgi:TP901 family phage tail tape measure protein
LAVDRRINIVINVDSAGVTRGVKQANAQLGTLNKTAGRILRTMSAFAALFIARGMVRGMVGMVKAAGDLQLQMIQIGRVSGIAGEELKAMRGELLNLSTTMVASIDELADLAIIAGRAGINTRKGMIAIAQAASMMGNVTDLSAIEATNALIKISKAMRLPISEAQKLGSVIVGVAKDFAASESEIVEAMLRMVGSGKLLGATAPQLTVLAAMTIELGLNARRAGMVWNRSFFQMGKNLEKAANIMGVTATEFRDSIDKDFIGSVTALLKKIAEIPSRVERLEKVREIFQLVGARGVALLVDRIDELNEAIEKANKQFEDGTELSSDFEKVLKAFNSQVKLTVDSFKALGQEIGKKALPPLVDYLIAIQAIVNAMRAIEGQEGLVPLPPFLALFGTPEDIAKAFNNYTEMLKKAREEAGIGVDGEKSLIPKPFPPKEPDETNEKIFSISATFEEAKNQIKKHLDDMGSANQVVANSMFDAWKSVWSGVQSSLSTAISSMILEGKKFKDILLTLWEGIKTSFVKAVADMLAELIIWAIQSLIVHKGITAGLVVMAKTVEAAWAGAAAMVSLATLGANVAPAMGALVGTKAFARGLVALREGGIVPGVGIGDRVPALLEPGELVIPKDRVGNVLNDNSKMNVSVSMAGSLIMDDPDAVEKLYREILRDKIREDIRTRRDVFFSG